MTEFCIANEYDDLIECREEEKMRAQDFKYAYTKGKKYIYII